MSLNISEQQSLQLLCDFIGSLQSKVEISPLPRFQDKIYLSLVPWNSFLKEILPQILNSESTPLYPGETQKHKVDLPVRSNP